MITARLIGRLGGPEVQTFAVNGEGDLVFVTGPISVSGPSMIVAGYHMGSAMTMIGNTADYGDFTESAQGSAIVTSGDWWVWAYTDGPADVSVVVIPL